jgi:hypothetical protein
MLPHGNDHVAQKLYLNYYYHHAEELNIAADMKNLHTICDI